MLFIDVKKAHLVPICHEDVYIELPSEAECEADECGKLRHLLYGCRKAGQAWKTITLMFCFKQASSVGPPVQFRFGMKGDPCGV